VRAASLPADVEVMKITAAEVLLSAVAQQQHSRSKQRTETKMMNIRLCILASTAFYNS
jgi:hypothetical protein